MYASSQSLFVVSSLPTSPHSLSLLLPPLSLSLSCYISKLKSTRLKVSNNNWLWMMFACTICSWVVAIQYTNTNRHTIHMQYTCTHTHASIYQQFIWEKSPFYCKCFSVGLWKFREKCFNALEICFLLFVEYIAILWRHIFIANVRPWIMEIYTYIHVFVVLLHHHLAKLFINCCKLADAIPSRSLLSNESVGWTHVWIALWNVCVFLF